MQRSLNHAVKHSDDDKKIETQEKNKNENM